MSRLSLLLFAALVFSLGASGCGSKKSGPQAAFAVRPTDPSATSSQLQNGADLLVARLARLGVPKDEIHVQQEGKSVTVEFPRNLVGARALPLVTRPTSLEVYDLENDLAKSSKTPRGEAKPEPSPYGLLAPQQQDVEFKGADAWELFDTSTKALVAGPVRTPQALFKTRVATARHIKPGKPPYVVFGVPKKTVVVSCGPEAVVCPGVGQPTARSWYLLTDRPEITSGDIASAANEVDPAQGPVVSIQLNGEGARKLREVTRALYQRGQLLQSPQHLAVVVDHRIRSFPQIDYTDDTLANGISGGGFQITGLRSPNEARELALSVEPLPVEFTRVGRQ